MIPPSGNTNEAIHAYFDWLWGQYLEAIPAPRTTVEAINPIQIFAAGFALLSFFVMFAFFFHTAHRQKGEIYGVASYAGNILERMGVVSYYTLAVFVYLFAWAFYFPIMQILFGQVY